MKKNNKRESIIIAVILLVILAVAFYLDAKLPSYHIAIKVIKKAAVYSTITQKVSNSFPQSISCSAQNLKLVAYRGVGMTCGLMLIGIFYKEGTSAAAFLILAICALVACLYYAALGVKERKCVS